MISSGLDRADAFVAFGDGQVLATGTGSDWGEIADDDAKVLDGNGYILTPGLIDIHNHGGAGSSYGDSAEAIRTARRLHLQHGTTRQLLSLVTAAPGVLISQIHLAAAETRRDPTILGIHLEGPFLAPDYCGAHDPALLRDPDPDLVKELLNAADGTLREITMAPERAHFAESARILRDAGVVVAVGHTAATFEQTRAAIDAGATLLTHAFNGMPGVHHRAPGPVFAFAEDSGSWLEVINDGAHVRPEVIRMLCGLAAGRVALVSDAMAATGVGDGRYRLGDLDVEVEAGVARLTGGDAIAGSTITLDVAVARAVQEVGLNPLAAVEAATAIPAQILGVADRFGRLEPGYVADAVLFDQDWQVRSVWIGGRPLGEGEH
ncbi:MAG TPA: N-acetylglucosamine-6-phosphate deacetylase [Propionibacteriaceae bacterium]|nr:N-acetylglucosamine-6-phosphate deacetylase [Propionibacteriaceae bacterium]